MIHDASINIGNIESAGMNDFEIWCARRVSNTYLHICTICINR